MKDCGVRQMRSGFSKDDQRYDSNCDVLGGEICLLQQQNEIWLVEVAAGMYVFLLAMSACIYIYIYVMYHMTDSD